MENIYKKWNTSEEDKLLEMLGRYSLPIIAVRLGRNVGGVERKIERLGINTRESGGDVTAYGLASVLNVDSHTVLRWIDKYGLPYTRKATKIEKQNIFIKPELFWKWAKQNKGRINFSKIPRHALPPEPAWVEFERRHDSERIPKRKQQLWTPEEDSVLLSMSEKGFYQKDIGRTLKRSTSGVQKRLAFLRQRENH